MSEAELDELIQACPILYHMAERGSWASIKQRGLLSTAALVDTYGVSEPQRTQILRQRRSKSIEINSDGLPRAVIRDQLPMSDSGLGRALPSGMEPSYWYALLNGKVFFWLSEKRLHKLTCARPYRNQEHDVLEIDTRSLINSYYARIWLCPINSGCTSPFPQKRDESAFQRIDKYPYKYWKKRRRRDERVAELSIDHGVPNIRDFVNRVIVKRGEETLSVIE